jgi:two-component system chemotaxis response regulator CheB
VEGAPERDGAADICVIGASAGGVEALQRFVAGLPADHPGSILVVLHLAPSGTSFLPAILQRLTSLICQAATDGEPLRSGRIYVAPANLHLSLSLGKVHTSAGPRENGHRPAIDPLFRSAADVYGERVVGVVLSGTRDDGTAGLAAIKRRGGVALVQDPDDAVFPGMPRSALDMVPVDATAAADRLADLVAELAHARSDLRGTAVAPEDPPESGPLMRFVCPDCGGTLEEVRQNGIPVFGCHVGHQYSMAGIFDEQGGQVEKAMWTAIRSLEDRGILLRRLSRSSHDQGHARSAQLWRSRADEADRKVRMLREVLERHQVEEARLRDAGAQEP